MGKVYLEVSPTVNVVIVAVPVVLNPVADTTAEVLRRVELKFQVEYSLILEQLHYILLQ